MDNPLISVVIPVYRQEQFLAEAIDSLLNQTYGNLEIVVVVDGPSTTVRLVEEQYPNVVFHHQTHGGVAAARNTGIKISRGELLSFLDADDRADLHKLALQEELLRNDPQLDCCLCVISNFLDSKSQSTDWFPKGQLGVSQIYITGMLARAMTFERYGFFNPEFETGEDTEWLSRAQNNGLKWVVARDAIIHRRIHSENLTRDSKASNDALLKILWNSVIQRRVTVP
jgi:glycosyltransferase involved in cell wall biosynthesis